MISPLRIYLKYLTWIVVIGTFSYVFQFIYSVDSTGFILTFFIAASLWLALWATR